MDQFCNIRVNRLHQWRKDELEHRNVIIIAYSRNPTPDGVPLMPGVPKWPAYDAASEYYMAIDRNWQVKVDYTQTYTVTVDEWNPNNQKIKHP